MRLISHLNGLWLRLDERDDILRIVDLVQETSDLLLILSDKLGVATAALLLNHDFTATHPLLERNIGSIVNQLSLTILTLSTLSYALRIQRIGSNGDLAITQEIEICAATHNLDRWQSQLLAILLDIGSQNNCLIGTNLDVRDINIHRYRHIIVVAGDLQILHLIGSLQNWLCLNC